MTKNDNGVLEFKIPGPPVAKQRPRLSKEGVAYTPAKTKNYERVVSMYAARVTKRLSWDSNENCDYKIMIYIKRANKRGDIDNYTKSVMDGMNGIVFPDDRCVNEIQVRMVTSRSNPGVWVGVVRKPRVEVDPECDIKQWIQSNWSVN